MGEPYFPLCTSPVSEPSRIFSAHQTVNSPSYQLQGYLASPDANNHPALPGSPASSRGRAGSPASVPPEHTQQGHRGQTPSRTLCPGTLLAHRQPTLGKGNGRRATNGMEGRKIPRDNRERSREGTYSGFWPCTPRKAALCSTRHRCFSLKSQGAAGEPRVAAATRLGSAGDGLPTWGCALVTCRTPHKEGQRAACPLSRGKLPPSLPPWPQATLPLALLRARSQTCVAPFWQPSPHRQAPVPWHRVHQTRSTSPRGAWGVSCPLRHHCPQPRGRRLFDGQGSLSVPGFLVPSVLLGRSSERALGYLSTAVVWGKAQTRPHFTTCARRHPHKPSVCTGMGVHTERGRHGSRKGLGVPALLSPLISHYRRTQREGERAERGSHTGTGSSQPRSSAGLPGTALTPGLLLQPRCHPKPSGGPGGAARGASPAPSTPQPPARPYRH